MMQSTTKNQLDLIQNKLLLSPEKKHTSFEEQNTSSLDAHLPLY
jgi:hypothetical protein